MNDNSTQQGLAGHGAFFPGHELIGQRGGSGHGMGTQPR